MVTPLQNNTTEYDSVMELSATLLTDSGCVRERNEDSGVFYTPSDPAVLGEKGVLIVVADGMGGHFGGEVASKLAVDTISRVYYEQDKVPAEALREAFQEANREIYEVAAANDDLKGMGTTCTALAIYNGSAVCSHVGDSRLYLVRGGEIYVMTEDHSTVMEMVRLGIISHEQARHHEDKNVITRALGTSPEVEVSVWDSALEVMVGDQFILCTDGLYDLVENREIKEVLLAGGDNHSACEALIDLAKKRGGYDNITVGLLRVERTGQFEIKQPRETRELEVSL